MPTAVGADAALGGPYKIKPSEAFSGALMTVSGLTGETISVETSPDGYWGAPASPTFYRTDWQGTQLLYSTARTNVVPLSTPSVGAVGYTFSGVAGANTTGPDGLTSAMLFAGGISDIYPTISAAVAAGTYTVSAWIYPSSSDAIDFLKVVDGAFALVGAGNLVNPVVIPNQWQRIQVSTVNPSLQAIKPAIRVGTGKTCKVGQFQIEPGSIATSQIPTTVGAVTITDYTLSNGVITLAEAPVTGATLSYDNSVLPSPYYIFATGDGVRSSFAYDGVWGTLSANSGKGNGIWQVDLRGAQAYRLVKSAGSETATVNMTLKRDALQYKNTAGTWSVT